LGKLRIKFHHNHPSFIEDMKNNFVSFFRTRCRIGIHVYISYAFSMKQKPTIKLCVNVMLH